MGMDIEVFALYGVCLDDMIEEKKEKIYSKRYSPTTGERLEDSVTEGERYYLNDELIGTYRDVINWIKSRIDDLKISSDYKEKLLIVEPYSYQTTRETFVGIAISDDFYGYPQSIHLEIHEDFDEYFKEILGALFPGITPKKYIITNLSI